MSLLVENPELGGASSRAGGGGRIDRRAIFARNSFLGRLVLLSGGTAAGQLLVILSSPIITRLFTPADLGTLSIFTAVVACFGGAVGLRFEMAVPLARRDEDAAAVTVLSLATIMAATILTTLVVMWSGTPSGSFAGLAPWLWLLAPCLMLWGIGLPLGYWSMRRGTFADNAVNRALQYAVQTVVQVGLGLAGAGTAGLIWGYVAGLVARGGHFLSRLRRRDFELLGAVRPAAILAAARREWRYPVFSSPSALLENAAQFVPVLLLAALYGPATAGWYGLAQRLLDLPVRLLSNAASEVFLSELGRVEPSAVHRLYVRTLSLFLAVGAVGALPLLMLAPAASAFVFGAAWTPAGHMIQALLPLQVARFAVIPVSQTLYALRRHDLHFLSAAVGVVAMLASFLAGWVWHLPALQTILLYSVTSAGGFALYAILALVLSRSAVEARAA